MSSKPTLILIALAALLALAAFLLLRAPTGGQHEQTYLLAPTSEPITEIVIWKSGQLVCRAETQAISGVPGWLQIEPIRHPLLSVPMQQIQSEAALLKRGEIAKGDDASLGLEPPLATLQVGGRGTIELGRRTVAGQAIARAQGEKQAYIVRDSLHRLLLDTDPVAWRRRSLFDNLSVEVARVRLERGEESILLARLRGAWRVIEPIGDHADTQEINRLLAFLIDSTVQSFLLDEPDDLGRFGLADPMLTVTVETDRRRIAESGEITIDVDRQTLHIGGVASVEGTLHYARRDARDCVTTIHGRLVEVLRTPLADLLSKRSSGLQASEVAAIEIVHDEEATNLRRTIEGWDFDPPREAERESASTIARDVLALLLEAKATRVVAVIDERSDESPATGSVTIELRGYDGGVLARFELTAADEATLAVHNLTTGLTRHYAEPELAATFLK